MKRIPSADLSGVKRLPIDLFYQCDALRTVTLAEDLVEIGEQAFYECKALETVTPFLPDSLEKMGRWAFVRCPKLGPELRLVSPKLGVIRDSTFFDTPALRNAIITGPTNIEYQVFKFCRGLTNVVLSPRLVSLGLGGDERGETFAECTSLRTVTPFLPKTLETIRPRTFDNCKALTGDLDLSNPAMTRPPKQVFRYCDKIRSVTFAREAVDFSDAYGIFFNFAKGQKLYFPKKAPVNLTGTFLFSTPSGENLPKTFYGSLRLDPDGWRAISRELTDKDRARPDFPGPATFGVIVESNPATSWHWCVDWRSPVEREATTILMLR